jgi:hypothetical protein
MKRQGPDYATWPVAAGIVASALGTRPAVPDRRRPSLLAGGRRGRAASALLLLPLAACELFQRPELQVPSEQEAKAAYASYPDVGEVRLSGNVVEVRARQSLDQLRRGGSLWARLGPYVYLFSPATRELFQGYNGLAAVRVITLAPGGVEVARATLLRDSTNEYVWRRGEAMLGRVLREATQRPGLADQFVMWGEEIAEFRYNPLYVPPRRRSESNP